MSAHWRFNGISREVLRGDSGGPILTVATPGDSIRVVPLSVKDLARILEGAATQLRVELEAGERSAAREAKR